MKANGHEKISQIFSGALIGNHWEIRRKPSKKPCKISQKIRCFCTLINRRLNGARGANRQKNARFWTCFFPRHFANEMASPEGCRTLARGTIPGYEALVSCAPAGRRNFSSHHPARAFSKDSSNRLFSQKPLLVTRCAPTALKMNYSKLKAKKSPFFSGPFDWKSLGNQTKTLQKVSPKCRNLEGLSDVFCPTHGTQYFSLCPLSPFCPGAFLPRINQ
jgi:hypothetical protein